VERLEPLLLAGDARVETVEPALEVGDRDVLGDDRAERREACDRLLQILDRDAQGQLGVSGARTARIVGCCDEAAEAARGAHGALRRAGEVLHAQVHGDVLPLEPGLRGEGRRADRTACRRWDTQPAGAILEGFASPLPGGLRCDSTSGVLLPRRAAHAADDGCSDPEGDGDHGGRRQRGTKSKRRMRLSRW
jgi:hypothetical protein